MVGDSNNKGVGGGAAASRCRRRRRRSTPLLPLVLLAGALAAAAAAAATATAPPATAVGSNQLLFVNGTAIALERREAPKQGEDAAPRASRRGSDAAGKRSSGAADAVARACCLPLAGPAAATVAAVDPAFALHSDPSCSPASRLCALPAAAARAVWVCGGGGGGARTAAAAAGSGPDSALGDPQQEQEPNGAKGGGGEVQGGGEAFMRGDGAVVAVRVAVASSSSSSGSGGGSKGGGGGKGSSSSSRCPVRGLQFEYTGGATLTVGAGFESSSSPGVDVKELPLLPGEVVAAVAGRVVGGGGASPSSLSSSSSSSRRGSEARGRGGRAAGGSSSSSSAPSCLAYVSLETSRGRELSAGHRRPAGGGASSSSSSSSSRGGGGGESGSLAVVRAPPGEGQQKRLVAAEALVRADGSLGWLRPLWGNDGCPAAAAVAAAAAAAPAPAPAASPANAAKNKPSSNSPQKQNPAAATAPAAAAAAAAAKPQIPAPVTQQQRKQQQPPTPTQAPAPPALPPRAPSNAYPLCGPPADPVCDRSTTPPRCFCMTDPPDNFLGQTCPEDGACMGGCCATTGQCPRVMGREAPKGYSGGPVQFFLARGCADWGLQPSPERTVAEEKAKDASEAARAVLPACGRGVAATAAAGENEKEKTLVECGALYDCVPPRGRPCAPGLPGALCMGYTRCKEEDEGGKGCVGESNEAACVYRPDGTRDFDVCGCRPIYPPPAATATAERRRRRRRLVF